MLVEYKHHDTFRNPLSAPGPLGGGIGTPGPAGGFYLAGGGNAGGYGSGSNPLVETTGKAGGGGFGGNQDIIQIMLVVLWNQHWRWWWCIIN